MNYTTNEQKIREMRELFNNLTKEQQDRLIAYTIALKGE